MYDPVTSEKDLSNPGIQACKIPRQIKHLLMVKTNLPSSEMFGLSKVEQSKDTLICYLHERDDSRNILKIVVFHKLL